MWPFRSRLSRFRKLAEQSFAFLVEEYGCAAPTYKVEKSWGDETLVYKNATTAVIITSENSYPGVFVRLARLKDGNVPPYPIFVLKEKSLEAFYLDDLVSLRDPGEAKLPADAKGLPMLANLTKKHAEKILRGDFSEYPILEEVVRQRAREGGEADYPKVTRFKGGGYVPDP